MSTCIIDGTKSVLRAGKEKQIPLVIDDYNKIWGALIKVTKW